MNLFVLVISLWGFTGTEWQYVGNQIVYQEPMPKEQCEQIIKQFVKYEYNEFYRMSLQCVSADDDKRSRSLWRRKETL